MKHLKKIHLKKFLSNKPFLLAVLFAIIFRLIFSFWTWHPDVNNHIDWGIRLYEYTPVGFYAPDANVWNFTWPNQPPGTIYMFAIIRFLFEHIFNLLLFINNAIAIFPSIIVSFSETNLYPAMLKLPAIFADFGIAYLIYKLVSEKSKKLARFASLIFLLNPAIWYNSSIWGQYDSVINFLFLAGIYFIKNKKILLSILCVALSLYIKISLVILLPIYAIYLIKSFKFSKVLLNSVIAFLFIILITLPFSGSENPIFWLYKLYTEKVLSEQLHLITANAFNFWGFISGIEWIPNSEPLLGKTFEFWGLVLFAVISIPIYIKSFFTKDIFKVLFSTGLVYFAAWMFLTNMHERYLYPFFVFSLPLVIFYSKSIWIYLSAAVLNLLNMYHMWYVPRFEFLINLSDSINKRFVSFLMLAVFVYFYIQFFRQTSRKKI